MNKVIVTITKTSAIFLTIVLLAGIFALYISPSFITVELQAQKEESEIEEEKCISYNKSEKLISISCKYADFADISKQITDPKILKRESTITTTNTTDNNEKVWLLNAGISVEKDATLNIDSGEVTWLKSYVNNHMSSLCKLTLVILP